MNANMQRIVMTCAVITALVSLIMLSTGCGRDDAESEQPDANATIVAAAVRTILEATAEAQANQPPPTATPAPTATPEPSPTPTAVPTLPPTPEPPPASGATGTDGGDPGSADVLAPLPINDLEAFLSEISDAERACLTQNPDVPPDRMGQLASNPELATPEERAIMLGCLEHDTELRLMLTPVLAATGPLTVESSACLRSNYEDVDLEELMGGTMGEPGDDVAAQQAMARGMIMFFVSLSCLNEDEFASAGQVMGIAPGEYENFQCVLEAAGGQEGMVAMMSPGAEFPAELFQAAFACGMQMEGPPLPPG